MSLRYLARQWVRLNRETLPQLNLRLPKAIPASNTAIFSTTFRSFVGEAKEDSGTKLVTRNEEIKADIVRFVQEDGTHEIVELAVALSKAKEAGVDLVQITQDDPPVVKIMDASHLEQSRREKHRDTEKKIRQRQKQEKTREIRLTPKIAPHDLEQKIKKINEFLEKRQKVLVVVMAPTKEDQKMGHEALQYIQSIIGNKGKICPDANVKRPRTVCMTLLPSHETKETKSTDPPQPSL